MKAYNDYGISDTTIGKATGLNRAQIRMYRTGISAAYASPKRDGRNTSKLWLNPCWLNRNNPIQPLH